MKTNAIVDLDAERAVLGSALLDDRTLLLALERITPEDFGHAPHQRIFEAMRWLATERKPVDTVSVRSVLLTTGELDRVGGTLFVAALPGAVPTASNMKHYAERVRACSRLRKFAEAASALAAEAASAIEADKFLGEAQSALLSLTEDTRQEVIDGIALADRAWKRIEERAEDDSSNIIETGIRGIDGARLLRRKSLVTLAARPAMGKTALAQNLIMGALDRGAGVFFVSIEMGEEELADRFIAVGGSMNTRDLERPKYMPESSWPRIMQALRRIGTKKFRLWEASEASIADLKLRSRRLGLIDPLDLIVVDYLQLMSGDRGDGRVQEISSISRGLKTIAKEHNACVLALSQLNREVEKRDEPIPVMSDLRDSGSIEQDSDAVMFLFRKARYPNIYQDANPRDAELLIRKHRHGDEGDVPLDFNKYHQQFCDRDGV